LAYFEKTNILSENICTLKIDIKNQLNRYIISKFRLSIIAWSGFLFYQKAVNNSRAPPFNLSKIHKNLRKVEQKMKTINLRKLYPLYYTEDCYIEVSDEVAEQIKAADRAEHAYIERIRYHKAYYSLDAGNGIEKDVIFVLKSP